MLDAKDLTSFKAVKEGDLLDQTSPFEKTQTLGLASGFTERYELRKQIGQGDQGSVYK